jgi:hypothetical protein
VLPVSAPIAALHSAAEHPMSDQLNYLAVGWESDHGVLSEAGRAYWKCIVTKIGEAYDEADDSAKRALLSHAAVLNRLSGFLLQVRRMIDHKEGLRLAFQGDAPPSAQQAHLALAGIEAVTDFESLLFHGRAVLDHLTLVVARFHGQNTDRFSRITNLLPNFTAASNEARRFESVLSQATQLAGVLTDLEGRSLRSILTHRDTVSGGATIYFTVYLLDDGRLLIFDCEAFGYGVLETSNLLSCEVPFVILNGVAVYLGLEEGLSYDDCRPTWENPAVRFSEWLDPTAGGLRFGVVVRMRPGGFEYRTEYLRSDVLARAVDRHTGRSSAA